MRKLGSVALERRIARLLDMDRSAARELVGAAWRRGDGRMTLRAAAFMLATTRLSPRVMPQAVRERAIRGFVTRLAVWEAGDYRLPPAYAGPGLLPS